MLLKSGLRKLEGTMAPGRRVEKLEMRLQRVCKAQLRQAKEHAMAEYGWSLAHREWQAGVLDLQHGAATAIARDACHAGGKRALAATLPACCKHDGEPARWPTQRGMQRPGTLEAPAPGNPKNRKITLTLGNRICEMSLSYRPVFIVFLEPETLNQINGSLQ